MAFDNPDYLWLLSAVLLFAGCALMSHLTASQWLVRFARKKKSRVSFAAATLFLSISLTALILCLAEPKVQYLRTVFNRGGIDLALGIDVSKSMLAEDEMIPPEGQKLFPVRNRLNRARYSALNILSALRGERVGVFMFASQGVEVIPSTTDYGYCQYLLKHLNDATITIPGSDLGQAIMTGIELLSASSVKRARALILISDGEDISDDTSAIDEAVRRAAEQGISIYTIGTGMGQGVLIPIRNAGGTAIDDYYTDEDGTYLKTRLEQNTLKMIAATTGGSYFPVSEEHCEDRVVEAIVKHARTVEYTKATEPAWFYLSPVLLGIGLLTFCSGIIASCW
jgi:Ca-activated chloride channel family protein